MIIGAGRNFSTGGKGVWGRKSSSGVNGRTPIGVYGRADDMFWK